MKKLLLPLLLVWVWNAEAQIVSSDTTNRPINSAESILESTGSNISLGAYAQIDYNQPIQKGVRRNGMMDVHRLVTFLGYRFNDKTHFVAEIEFEHVIEVYVEQAFLNYHITPALNLRAGLLLIPMGIMNEYHEPPTYFGVERPNLEHRIIPTTWREMGAGLAGNLPNLDLKYQVYLVNGFNGYDGTGRLGGNNGLRSGRQKGAESYISSPNLSGKVDYYGLPGLKMGLAGYWGKTQSTLYDGLNKNDLTKIAEADSSTVNVSMLALDARYQLQGFTIKALVVNSALGNTLKYNQFTGKDLGSGMFGYYVEAGYDVLRLLNLNTTHRLDFFARYEKHDIHNKVEGDMLKNKAYDRTDITIGAGWKVAPGAVFKADYQIYKDEVAGSESKKQLNFGVGIWF